MIGETLIMDLRMASDAHSNDLSVSSARALGHAIPYGRVPRSFRAVIASPGLLTKNFLAGIRHAFRTIGFGSLSCHK